MGFLSGILKWLIKCTLYFTIFAAIIVLIPNLPPYAKYSSRQLDPPQPREGSLAPNTVLNNAKKLYLNKVHGPEAFQIFDGELYTGMSTGEIVKISPDGHVTFVTKIGQPCVGEWQEHICGRPLGFQIDEKNKQLYVVDSYYGIWKVDLKTDKKQLLVSPSAEIERRAPRLLNSLALVKNGDLYWTDSSSDFTLRDGVYSMLADPSGRLFHYDAAKNRSRVLIDGLWFANGVGISPDNQFVVVSETSSFRLMRYYIDGPKKGQKDVFVQGLPGAPDNIQTLPDGSGILVGLYTMFDEKHPLLIRSMAPVPVLRKFLARLQRLIELPFEMANNIYPHYFFEYMVYMIGNFKSVASLMPPLSGLVQIDWNGKIVAAYFNTDGSLSGVSDAVVFNDMLYIGSPHQHFIGAVPAPEALKNAFSPIKKIPPVKKAETVTMKIPDKKVEKPIESKPAKPVQSKEQNEKKPEMKQPAKEPSKPNKAAELVKPTQKPKTDSPKQKVTTEAPKPTTQAPPKTTTESVKPTTQAPKSPERKAATTPPPADTKPKVQPKETVTKQNVKPKINEPENKKRTEPDQKRGDKPITNNKQKSSETKNAENRPDSGKPVPELIPITEEIPSDTAEPNKDTLKVIKKEGPTEIPNPKI